MTGEGNALSPLSDEGGEGQSGEVQGEVFWGRGKKLVRGTLWNKRDKDRHINPFCFPKKS